MPAEVHFLSDRSTLFFTYSDPLTIDEIEASLNAYYPLLDEVSTTVHSILDVTRLTHLPPKVMSAFTVKRLVYGPLLAHPMLGISVVVIGNSRIGAVAHIAAHVYSTKKVRVVHTLEAAWAEIDHLRHL